MDKDSSSTVIAKINSYFELTLKVLEMTQQVWIQMVVDINHELNIKMGPFIDLVPSTADGNKNIVEVFHAAPKPPC